MNKLLPLLLSVLLPLTAEAYVGPGAGLSLLGALWALVLALGTALVFVVAWPVRRMMRRRREAQTADMELTLSGDESDLADTDTSQTRQ